MNHLNNLPVVYRYVAAPGQTSFPFQCRAFSPDAFEVTVDGAPAVYTSAPASANAYKVVTDYALEGGSIVFGAAVAAGRIVEIRRRLSVQRVSAYPNSGPVPMSTINLETDRHLGIMQDQAADIAALRARLMLVGNISQPSAPVGVAGDGVTDDTSAINFALSQGGEVFLPGPARYRVTNRLLMLRAYTTLKLGAGAVIEGCPWRYNGSQFPFGSLIYIEAPHCAVIGAGMGMSRIELTGGSEANGITFHHTDGGRVADLTVHGGKAHVTAKKDDTFFTGVLILNATAYRPTAGASRVIVERVEAVDFMQYGLQCYGDLAQAVFRDCVVHSIGVIADVESVGTGIAMTRAPRNCEVRNCLIYACKGDAVFISSAGLNGHTIALADNTFQQNGGWGINVNEEPNKASVPGQGINGITSTDNSITGNGRGGIVVGTYEGAGILMNVTSEGDLIRYNNGIGILIQTNNHPENRTSFVHIDSTITGNTGGGLGMGPGLDNTISWNASKITNNPVANVIDDRGLAA